MQTRVRYRVAHRFTELGDNDLLNLLHRVEAAEKTATTPETLPRRQASKDNRACSFDLRWFG